jgi:hypothetical protein
MPLRMNPAPVANCDLTCELAVSRALQTAAQAALFQACRFMRISALCALFCDYR